MRQHKTNAQIYFALLRVAKGNGSLVEEALRNALDEKGERPFKKVIQYIVKASSDENKNKSTRGSGPT